MCSLHPTFQYSKTLPRKKGRVAYGALHDLVRSGEGADPTTPCQKRINGVKHAYPQKMFEGLSESLARLNGEYFAL